MLLRRGRNWNSERTLGQQDGVEEHIRYLAGLYEQGVVERAGPFYGYSERVAGELVGIVIYRVGRTRAAERARHDPAVRSGLMEFQAFAWHP